MIGEVFIVRLAILSALTSWAISIIICRADSDTFFKERVGIKNSCAVLDANFVLSKVPKGTNFDTKESSRVCVQSFRTVSRARSIESILIVGRAVQYTDPIDLLSVVIRRALCHTQHVNCISEVARRWTQSKAFSCRSVSIIWRRRDRTEQYAESFCRRVIVREVVGVRRTLWNAFHCRVVSIEAVITYLRAFIYRFVPEGRDCDWAYIHTSTRIRIPDQ